jgi:single-strand DNA-binding protein
MLPYPRPKESKQLSNETIITIVGNLTADPTLMYTQSGLAVANFTIASTPRHFDKQRNEWVDDDALFLRASVWREHAEHVAGSLSKGTRVVAIGQLKMRQYEDNDGNKRTSTELDVHEIGASLRYATAQVTRVPRSDNGAVPQTADQGDVWNTPGSYNDETPF